jgi:fumarylacetoacetase
MPDPSIRPHEKSWLESANAPGCDFPLQNLPYCAFRPKGWKGPPRLGVGIGDRIFDLKAAIKYGLLHHAPDDAIATLGHSTLNEYIALGPDIWRRTRAEIARLLEADTQTLREDNAMWEKVSGPMDDADLFMPVVIGNYTDFYASIHHATNVGSMMRPDQPLMPNYKHLPVGYHGRASSIVISGTPVKRPNGQTKAEDADAPKYGPCRLLDYEMELGFFIGQGNELGTTIPMSQASKQVFGLVMVNDWSARDVQKWEYQPLGPFNAKNFATTISPWVVPLDAVASYRVEGPPRDSGSGGSEDPAIIDYLKPADDMALEITLSVSIASEKMRADGLEPVEVSRGSFREMYWTIAQMLVHHTSTGCNLRPGDLIASGTISGPEEESRGCLLERTWRGEKPLDLPDGTTRKFLEDGDEVIMRAWCEKEGAARIGFGECRGVVMPAE